MNLYKVQQLYYVTVLFFSQGCVYIKCSSCEKAYDAYQSLHGWWFDGKPFVYLLLETLNK